MGINSIYEGARLQPAKPALIYNDAPISYELFARSIEAVRKFFEQQQLPAGQTAIVLVNNLVSAWAVVIALRAAGLNTVSVETLARAKELQLRDVACVVTTRHEQDFHNIDVAAFPGTRVVVVPVISPAD